MQKYPIYTNYIYNFERSKNFHHFFFFFVQKKEEEEEERTDAAIMFGENIRKGLYTKDKCTFWNNILRS